MNGTIRNLIILKSGTRPHDESWYIQQVIPSVGLSMAGLQGARVHIHYVNTNQLDKHYVTGFVMASGHDLGKCTVTPFADRDGGNGLVVKVFE